MKITWSALHSQIAIRWRSEIKIKKIKSSLYSPYYAEACNELRGPSPRLSAWATQLRGNVATVASRWRHYADLTRPGIEPQTSRTDNARLATELTAGPKERDPTCKQWTSEIDRRQFVRDSALLRRNWASLFKKMEKSFYYNITEPGETMEQILHGPLVVCPLRSAHILSK